MGDAHLECDNTSPGVALPTLSSSIDPIHASSGFLSIDTCEICVRHLNLQLEPYYHGKYKASLRAVVQPIYMSCYDLYA